MLDRDGVLDGDRDGDGDWDVDPDAVDVAHVDPDAVGLADEVVEKVAEEMGDDDALAVLVGPRMARQGK